MFRKNISKFLIGLPLGLLFGNFLGIGEIYYITYHLKTLAATSSWKLIQYLAGGALLYGLLCCLVFGILTLIISCIQTTYKEKIAIETTSTIFLASLGTILVFPTFTQQIYLDVPGIFEIPRFWDIALLSLAIGTVIYYFCKLNFVKNLISKTTEYFSSRTLAILLSVNLLFLLLSLPLYLSEVPGKNVPQKETAKTPIIFIGVDTLRADHLNSYNDELSFRTPAADQLAADGVVYLKNTAQWPRTTPSFASILTSLYPAEIPIYSNSTPIPPTKITLAEKLQEVGYSTQGIVSSFAVHEKFLGQGFGDYVNREDWGLKNLKLIRYLLSLTTGDMPTSLAKKYISKISPRNNFFLFLHYIIPHAPYRPPYPYSLKLESSYYWGQASGSQEALSAVRERSVYRSERDLKHIRKLYDGEVAYTDAKIQEFLERLKEEGLYKKSLIIYGSDHGENMDQHGHENWFKHDTLYQSDLDVPLIIKYPENRHAGTKIKKITSNLDIAPTILSVIDAKGLPDQRGQSLIPGEIQARKYILSQKKYSAGLRTAQQKFILRFQGSSKELYNLESDPAETENLAQDNKKKVPDYTKVLEEFQQKYYKTPQEKEKTAKELKRLEGLGYVD